MDSGELSKSELVVNEVAAWAAVTILHLAIVYLFSEKFASAWLEVPIALALVELARRGVVSWNLALCFTSALCYLLGDPAVAFAGSIWFTITPQLAVIARESRLKVLAVQGLWTGFIAASGIYAWIWPTVRVFFDVGVFGSLPFYVILCLAISVQLAVFFPLMRIVWDRIGWPLGLLAPGLYAMLEYFLSLPTPIALPLGLVSQPVFLQTLDIAGVTGTTLLVSGVGAAVYEVAARWKSRDTFGMRQAGVVAVLLMGVVLAVGGWKYDQIYFIKGRRNYAMIQPVAPLRIVNKDTAQQEEVCAELKQLSLDALAEDSPSVLIWPEGAGAFASRTPQFNAPYMRTIREIQSAHPVTVVANDIEFFRAPGEEKLRYWNTISVIEPDGTVSDSYRKNILMPFGEYLPLETTFPILRKWFPNVRSIAAGSDPKPLTAAGIQFAPLICYEVLFPDYVRRLVTEDVGYIAVLTNDRWYGPRQQPPQHFAFAILRAIENRRDVFRSANSGISGVINDDGKVSNMTSAMEKTYVRFQRTGPSWGPTTLYTRYGDYLPRYILAPIYASLLLFGFIRKRRDST